MQVTGLGSAPMLSTPQVAFLLQEGFAGLITTSSGHRSTWPSPQQTVYIHLETLDLPRVSGHTLTTPRGRGFAKCPSWPKPSQAARAAQAAWAVLLPFSACTPLVYMLCSHGAK